MRDINEHTPGEDLIIKTAVRLLVPFAQLFGLYVVVHGHYSPGGGFQGGVILGPAGAAELEHGVAELGGDEGEDHHRHLCRARPLDRRDLGHPRGPPRPVGRTPPRSWLPWFPSP